MQSASPITIGDAKGVGLVRVLSTARPQRTEGIAWFEGENARKIQDEFDRPGTETVMATGTVVNRGRRSVHTFPVVIRKLRLTDAGMMAEFDVDGNPFQDSEDDE